MVLSSPLVPAGWFCSSLTPTGSENHKRRLSDLAHPLGTCRAGFGVLGAQEMPLPSGHPAWPPPRRRNWSHCEVPRQLDGVVREQGAAGCPACARVHWPVLGAMTGTVTPAAVTPVLSSRRCHPGGCHLGGSERPGAVPPLPSGALARGGSPPALTSDPPAAGSGAPGCARHQAFHQVAERRAQRPWGGGFRQACSVAGGAASGGPGHGREPGSPLGRGAATRWALL